MYLLSIILKLGTMTSTRTQDEQALVLLVGQLTRLYRRSINRALAIHGLSDAQAMPVLLISRLGDGLRQGVLADRLGVEGPSLVRQLDQLEASGLVERRADSHDRRAKTLHLTENGRAFADKIEAVLGEQRQRLLASLSDEELAATLVPLRRFEQAISAAIDNHAIPDRS